MGRKGKGGEREARVGEWREGNEEKGGLGKGRGRVAPWLLCGMDAPAEDK